jgi:outer membrane protein TolC
MRFCALLLVGLTLHAMSAVVRAQVLAPPTSLIVPLPPIDEPSALPSPSIQPIGYQELFGERRLQAAPISAVVEPMPLDSDELPPSAADVASAKIAQVDDGYPIDLATAVHLAGGQSLAVALAREQSREAAIRVRAAEALWLPSIRIGLNYNKHEGVIQDVAGNPINTSRGAFYNGLGAGAVGAGSPAYPGLAANFHLADALVQPLAARQVAASRNVATSAARNDALLEGALAYLDLLGRAQETAVAAETRSRAAQLAELTAEFSRIGTGTLADADRARVELSLRDADTARTREGYEVARARLAQILRLDPMLKLTPTDESVAPLELTDVDLPVAELVARGLSSRPELAEHRHLVCAAVERLRRERLAPLVPSVLVGTSYGGFGSGLGGDINGYGDRFDFDAVAYWEVRNLGVGDQAARGIAQSQINQARLRQLAVMDLVAREVVEAHAAMTARREQLTAAGKALGAAQDSYRRNFDRIHGGEGLPIETLQSLQAWASAEREYVRAVTDFNAAQFRLQRATGWPINAHN